MAAHRPEEVLAAAEGARLVGGEDARRVASAPARAVAVEVLGEPVQRVQVAQAALAVLDVGLDPVARLAGAAVALVALGELGLDERRARVPLHHLARKRCIQLVEQRCVAEDQARVEQRGADGHVGAAPSLRHWSTVRVAWPTLRPRSHSR